MKKSIKSLIVTLLLCISKVNLLALEITPVSFGQKIDYSDGGYKEYTLTNDSPERVRYKVNFFGENIDKFDTKVYPEVFILEPFEKRKFKMLIKQKEDMPTGEYKFLVGFTPIKVPTITKEKSNEIGLNASLGIALAIEMYGYVGELGNPKTDVKFSNFEFDKSKKELRFDLDNKLERSIKISLVAYKSFREKEEFTDYIRVGKNKKINIKVPLKELDEVKSVKIFNSETEELLYDSKL